MTKGVILHPNDLPAHKRGNGNKTIPLAGPRIGAGFLNGITVIAPGSAIPLHTHNCEESVVVLEGDALAEIDGEQHKLVRHDASWIPADLPHRFINASQTEPLTILWTYARPDATRTLVETGETRPVSAEHRR
ncbi:cupin domain-containing protein (plasmid) [Lichenicola cladoniae]|uniref:Cupin domain-containing protein n=1 Tax=Lichenicola cladoniae TaxID=1484109 RepID=A0A6M8HXL7_9PROT|nr:cupin domain-containing protein [Lichenicola cladoniae]NPD68700.1 cupin domain-containing protein [Acetobacteraceae bacterium]QKE93080.1 cupin domain-containing protein [Lichenicola cladoniae]